MVHQGVKFQPSGRGAFWFVFVPVIAACGVSRVGGPAVVPTSDAAANAAGPDGGPVGGTGGTNAVRPDAGAEGPNSGLQSPDAAFHAPDAPVTVPPLSGITVSINGAVIPKEKVVVLLHLGHSNMAGRAKDPADQIPYFYNTDPHLWRYQAGGIWTPAKEWLCPDGGTPGISPSNQGAGPGMALLRHALALAPDSYVVSIGQGKAVEFSGNCFSFRKGGIFYETMMGPARELKGKVTFGGLFVMLSFDARTDPRAQNGGFLSCLNNMAADYRTDLGEPNLPFIMGDYERGATGDLAPTCCGAPQVIAQLSHLEATISNSFLIPTDGIPMQDDHHYNMAGHRLWADRAFAGMAAKGFLPWATK
jgi:hypothetical protein